MVESHKKKEKTLSGQDKLLVDKWQKRMARKEKDRQAQQDWEDAWTAYLVNKSKQQEKDKKPKKTKEESEAAAGDDKDEDEDYHTSENAGDASSIDPSDEPSKKEL